MNTIRRSRLGSFTATFLFMWSGIASGQGLNIAESWLPFAGVQFSDNGDLVGWQVGGLNDGMSELIEPRTSLLTIQLFLAGKDISNQITWRRLADKRDFLGRFIGTYVDPPLEIHRNYRIGAGDGDGDGDGDGTIVHHVRANTKSGDFRILLRISPNLVKHSTDDNSLGHFFYSYYRFFAFPPKLGESFEPVRQQRLATAAALVTRHVAVVVTPKSTGRNDLQVDPENGIAVILNQNELLSAHRLALGALELRGAELGNGRFRDFLYSDMWSPLRGLARQIERCLQYLTIAIGSPGVAIIIFAILVRLALMPIGLWSIRQQRIFATTQQKMKPKLKHIDDTFSGAEKNEQILQTYKEYGISPFSGLKGSIALFVQLPILIAVFSVTTETALFRNVPFLWFSDLSLPDQAMSLPFSIPGLGAYINLLPIILGAISSLSALIQARSSGPGGTGSPRSGLILALVFVVFFYSCAAALVLYWVVVNLSQILESAYVTRAKPMYRP